jgi:phosphoribosylglycinamide formyltransferase-1
VRVAVLASGSGTLLQALLDAQPTDGAWEISRVGSDLADCPALARARAAGVPTFSVRLAEFSDRNQWNIGLADACGDAEIVILAGFMKLVSPAFLGRFPQRVLNSHPSLLPAFPGMRAAEDALEYGVKVTGCTLFLVDEGVDAGPIIAQRPVEVLADDTVETLHERIKVAERSLLVDVVTAMAAGGWNVNGRKVRVNG